MQRMHQKGNLPSSSATAVTDQKEASRMKGKNIRFLTTVLVLGFLVAFSHVPVARAEVALEVLNPRGEVAPKPILAPCPRIPDLSGKKIGVYWNSKAGGDHFWDV